MSPNDIQTKCPFRFKIYPFCGFFYTVSSVKPKIKFKVCHDFYLGGSLFQIDPIWCYTKFNLDSLQGQACLCKENCQNKIALAVTIRKIKFWLCRIQLTGILSHHLHSTQPQAVAHHKHAAERHCASGQHRHQKACRGRRNQDHIVNKRPEQVLFNRSQRFSG
jgi:hypothetical protein